MYFDESGYFLDCSTGFISRSKKGLNGSNSRMVSSEFLSYSFRISTKSEATLVLGVLAGLVHGEDVSLTQELGSLGLSTTDLIDGLQGGVEVTGADEVAGIEG